LIAQSAAKRAEGEAGLRSFRVRFRMLDGSEHESSGEYLEVVKPERLSMSWRWTGGVEDPGESLVEIRLRAIVEGTELTFTHSRLRDEETRSNHEEGWTGALDKLGTLRDQASAADFDYKKMALHVMWSKPSTSFSLRHGNRKGAYRMITISAFKWVPEFAQGQVRDLRARWALEEAGGVRVRHMPITAEAVLAGLKKKA
jgi:hypothetical protein